MSALRDWSPGFLYEIQPPPFPMRKLRVYFPTAQEIQWKSRSRIDSEVSTVVPAHEFPGLVLYPVQSKTPSLSSCISLIKYCFSEMPFLMMLYKMKAILLHFLSSFADFVFSLYNHQVGKKR